TQRYVLSTTTDTPILTYPNVPATSELGAVPQTVQQVDPSLKAPVVIQGAIGVERQLPKRTTLALTFTYSHGVHQLLTRNINAPIVPDDDSTRPYGAAAGNIYNYESDGTFNQKQ